LTDRPFLLSRSLNPGQGSRRMQQGRVNRSKDPIRPQVMSLQSLRRFKIQG